MSVSKFHRRTGSEKSQGAEVEFQVAGKEEKLTVYTTRPDTLFGATYMVVSPEHPMLDKYKEDIKNWDAIQDYREQAAKNPILSVQSLQKTRQVWLLTV